MPAVRTQSRGGVGWLASAMLVVAVIAAVLLMAMTFAPNSVNRVEWLKLPRGANSAAAPHPERAAP